MANLTTKICGVSFFNPTILASGILGVTGASLLNVVKNGAGGVVTKSISLKERKGHPAPVILSYEGGLINAVGLSTMGLEDSLAELKFYKEKTDAPLIASIFASSIAEFGQVAKAISEAKPDLIEVNISCPNVESEFGRPFGTDPEVAAEVTKTVKANTNIPIIIKLSPNVTSIVEIAQAVELAGADAISAINTIGPGMIIDVETKKPILANKMGGVSGPAIRPIAVRCIYQIYQKVKIPIIGIGGVTTGRDAIEMMLAGAQAVQIGSAVYYHGPEVFGQITKEINQYLDDHHYQSLSSIIGKAHE